MTDRKYIENPKMKGSGMYACIPQKGTCPNKCPDCFFQSGRSYLEPLDDHLPNLPQINRDKIVRVNDGNDSFFLTPDQLQSIIYRYPNCFFNTSVPKDLTKYHTRSYSLDMPNIYMDNNDLRPVVLTLNPGEMTDTKIHSVIDIPKNLMMVRFRVNMWNLALCDTAVEYYATKNHVPVILTFMAYYTESVPKEYQFAYEFRTRTLNSYWAIKRVYWKQIMERYEDNRYVYSCGHDGDKKDGGNTECRFCGNCLREFHATMERLENRK